jgi:hypothetical protein
VPTLWAHSLLFNNSDTAVAPIVVSRPGYPAWQSGVILPSAGGWCQRTWERIAWLWTWLLRVWHWTPDEARWFDARVPALAALSGDQRRVVDRVLAAVQHPAFPMAQVAVRETSQILGFNKPQAWARLGTQINSRYDWAENSWRHLQAMQALDRASRAAGSTLTNPDKNLLTELAYVEFASGGVRRR